MASQSIGIVWGPPSHSIVKRVLAVAAYGGVVIDSPEFTHFVDNKKPEFLRKFPLGQIPAFEGKDGFLLTQTPAIMKYIASHSPKASELLGKTAQEQALVDQWLSFAMSELQESISRIFRMLYGLLPYSEPEHARYAAGMMRALGALDKHLAGRAFLVGDDVSVADILVAGVTQTCAAFAMGARERAQVPHAMRHLETLLASSPGVAAVYGPTMLNETAPAYTPPSEEKPWEKLLDAQPTSKA